ncbi:MAG: prolipoprotein diacylglyceryl transferase [Gaiellales bacterium]
MLSIPSPGDPFVFQLGGFQPRWYGLLLAVAVLAAVWMTRRRFRACGLDPELVFPVAVCAVLAGFAGARIEHIATDWSVYRQIPANMFWIWRGGLGIYGGIVGGMLGAVLGCRLVRLPFWTVADCAAPGLVLAQAIGRVGNYTNQELYGHPSGLPWAIRIAHPLPPYLPGDAFQPTFLYETLWDLAVLGVLLWFVRGTANRLRPASVFALYAGLYSLGRLWIETIRIDPTDHVLGQRVDIWVAGLVCVLAAAVLAVLWGRRPAAA